ncbi:hypothetical protein [Clostridium cylindrosporum]|uniref:Uncharacterized protein n=1 Tax=Clostridium cylindrosporum DSM 605 TaxID=1121307 RepID=A0A0J8G3P4_CLOCY|nr:hypothetical protein [Clostridium cylindrosporum]KMT22336.1 hypothetical protein CLCY_16c00150 [Clostridium cylindrosporum DSM 605]
MEKNCINETIMKEMLEKYSRRKEFRIQFLKDIIENKIFCLEFIDELIKQVNDISPGYIEGYEMEFSNERRSVINEKQEDDVYYISLNEREENIKLDIILRNQEEDILIGTVDCNVKTYGSHGENLNIKINSIEIYKEYRNRGYGTRVLNSIPRTLSRIYKGRISRVETTSDIIPSNKYELHKNTYCQEREMIDKFLVENKYEDTNELSEIGEGIYKLNLYEFKTIDYYINSLIDSLFKIMKNKDKNSEIENCKNIIETICDDSYIYGTKEEKILSLENIKEKIEKYYEHLKIRSESIISAFDEIKELYKKINIEIKFGDSVNEVAIKLYCKYLTYAGVCKELDKRGYVTYGKTGIKRKYNSPDVKEMIINNDIANEELKNYVDKLIIANNDIR